MRQVESQTGNEVHEEPLRMFLLSAFGPLTEVEPEYLQSNHAGAKCGIQCKDDASDSDGEDDDEDKSDGDDAAVSFNVPKKIKVKGTLQNLFKSNGIIPYRNLLSLL